MHYFVEVKKFITFVIMAKLMCSHRASGFIANISRPVNCQGSTAAIDFDFDLAGGSIISGSKVWLFNQYPIAQDTGSGFTALNNYTSRLTSHSGDGLTLSNVTTADAGSYKYELVLVAGFIPKTATASFTVYIGPLNPSSPLGCLVKASQVGSTVKCTVSGNCGTPPLIPSWINVATTDHFECKDSGTYQCCATGAVLPLCYSGSSNDFCTQFKCETTTTTVTETNETSASTPTSSFNNTPTAKEGENDSHQLVIIISVSVIAAVLVIIIIYCCLHHRRKRKKDQTKHTAHHAIARNESKSTNELNELHNVTNTSQVDSCFKM